MSFRPAARVEDLVKHTYANETMIVFAVIGGGIGAFFGGPVGAALGAGVGKELGEYLGNSTWIADNISSWKEGIPEVVTGSFDVYTNRKRAARVQDRVKCHGKAVIQGSQMVSINLRPATRVDDLTECGAIGSGSSDVWMGGPPVTQGEYEGSTNFWLSFGIDVLGGAAKNLAKMPIRAALKKALAEETTELLKDQLSEQLRQNGMGSVADTFDGYRTLNKWGTRYNDLNKVLGRP